MHETRNQKKDNTKETGIELMSTVQKHDGDNNKEVNEKQPDKDKSGHIFDRISRFTFPSVYVIFLISYFVSYYAEQ